MRLNKRKHLRNTYALWKYSSKRDTESGTKRLKEEQNELEYV